MSPSRRDAAAARHGPRSAAVLIALAMALGALFAGFVALGNWQVERRAWKLDLIARVDQRVHAAPVAAPGPDRWQQVSAAGDEYRRVRVAGTFLHELQVLVQASTELGSGFWVMTPLKSANGSVILVNRGFVPSREAAREAIPPAGEVTVTGLLRISEPRGALLRRNDPEADRWYSRDVAAIATARGLSHVAPYFVDAQAGTDAASRTWPMGGLTVIAFRNHHGVYAITWYALALMVAGAAWLVWREETRLRHPDLAQDTERVDQGKINAEQD